MGDNNKELATLLLKYMIYTYVICDLLQVAIRKMFSSYKWNEIPPANQTDILAGSDSE